MGVQKAFARDVANALDAELGTRTRRTGGRMRFRSRPVVRLKARDDDDEVAHVKKQTRRRTRDAQVVMFRRGAYKNVVSPAPWTTTWRAPSEKLRVVEGADARDMDTSRKREIVVEAYVEPAGASGFFVDAVVRGDVFVKCACCGATFAHELPGTTRDVNKDEDDDGDSVRFLAFLDADAKEETSSGDYDVFPFPRTTDELDLTALVRDSVRAFGLPSETVCAECAVEVDRASWSIE